MNLHLFVIAVVLTAPSLCFADFTGKVIKVYDGDTITVLNEQNETIKIRLNGIDAPEKAQAFGKKSQKLAASLVMGKTVTIIDHGEDRYHRIIGDVVLEDGRVLNQELVRAGLAWWFRRYSDDRELAELELDAKLSNSGLWRDKNAIPPWIYRKLKPIFR
ncbi:MAG: endonuclease [Nitrospirales bacterium]|nr:MAG: endonuclease [Nitrospirales bacterium]